MFGRAVRDFTLCKAMLLAAAIVAAQAAPGHSQDQAEDCGWFGKTIAEKLAD